MVRFSVSNYFPNIFPVDLLRGAEPGLSHRLQPRSELRGDAEELLVLLPQPLVVLQQTGVLVLENVELCGRL